MLPILPPPSTFLGLPPSAGSEKTPINRGAVLELMLWARGVHCKMYRVYDVKFLKHETQHGRRIGKLRSAQAIYLVLARSST
jgi:hypothetical protein